MPVDEPSVYRIFVDHGRDMGPLAVSEMLFRWLVPGSDDVRERKRDLDKLEFMDMDQKNTFRVYSGTYDEQGHFEADLGFGSVQQCESEAAAVLYVCNKWPALRVAPAEQVGSANRNVIWIFADAEQREPCAAMVSLDNPKFRPNWELWRPFFDGRPPVLGLLATDSRTT